MKALVQDVDNAVLDPANVRVAVRLGWLIAEVRGRADPNGPGPGPVTQRAPGNWVLPLGSERSVAEREAESAHALAAVAQQLDADPPFDASQTAGSPPATQPPSPGVGSGPRYSDQLKNLLDQRGKEIPQARNTEVPQEVSTWDRLAKLLYDWDAKIQDALASRSDLMASGYELGRALAEAYWALNAKPQENQGQDTPPNLVGWEFFLGPGRRKDIARLLSRLAAYLPPLTAPAVASSVEIWGRVARDKDWRCKPSACGLLYDQVGKWYSLVVVGVDPKTTLKPYAVLGSWRIFRKTFRAFGWELIVGLVSVALLAALLLLLAYGSKQPALKGIVGTFGVLGITTACFQARLKATTQSMVTRLRQDLTTDLLAEQITVTPAPPVSKRKGKRIREQAIDARWTDPASLEGVTSGKDDTHGIWRRSAHR
jgi:hypothetical protein